MAIRMVRGYRTISREAANLLAGLPPWYLEATVLVRMHDLRVEMQRRGETPLPRLVAVWRTGFRRDLRVAWRLRLSQPSAGHAVITAVSPLFEVWLERGHGGLSFRMTQVLTGHGKFGRFRHRIKKERTPGCRHCVDRSKDTVEHRVEVCPTWAEYRRIPVEAVGGGDLSRQALVQVMIRSEEGWRAVASFCEAVILVKEAADRERVRERPSRRRDPDPSFRPP
ncbi:hypothetical protein PYW07_010436 [Mythimna separata]|uniref:Reverse transcriptase n=1 Tax=Mythimna separata TaxID=271217 RepID=A0AAD7Y9T9_MYTSE|nr:hypothetical protein PYW07_010436 [Mythimna separata]